MEKITSWQGTSSSSAETKQIAESLGTKLRGGELIELVSDLGGGKTTFVSGLAKGLGYESIVNSPSFSLRHEYQTDRLKLEHFDFYRLSEPGIMREQLAEVMADPQAVLVIEWADITHDVLPDKRLVIILKASGESSRQIIMEAPESLAYLLPGESP